MSPLRPSRWYRLAVATASAAARLGARFSPKLSRGLSARRGLEARYAAWGAAQRRRHRPLVWFHAPSVGEGLQVKPVLEALRATHPDWQLAYSFFSPSAESLARALPADFAEYAPLDRPRAVGAALDALTPSALVFGKLDVWPEWTLAAAARRVRLGLISGTVSAGSSRLRWPARGWAAAAYAALDRVGAASEDDAVRLQHLGVRRDTLEITGDTRYDSVTQRARALDRSREPLATLATGRAAFTVVAGSTWPADEAVVLAAFAELWAGDRGAVRLIVAPHEPTPAHLAGLAAAARRAGLPAPVPLSRFDANAPGAALIVVDRVGVLADLYALGQTAYVGGGYHRAGLHSVLEPAVFGIPVCVGPRWRMSRDAAALIARAGAVALPADGTGAGALARQWQTWWNDPAGRERAGAAAAAVVAAGCGATARSVTLVESLVEAVPGGAPPP